MTTRELQRAVDLGCPLHPGRDCMTWDDHDPHVRRMLLLQHELLAARLALESIGRMANDDHAGQCELWECGRIASAALYK